MEIRNLDLEGVKLVVPNVFSDDRGFFLESYHEPRYREHGIPTSFNQDNHSYSSKGTIRGMHFQLQPGQDKLVRVVVGEIYDVAVDIRPGSPTFGKWLGVTLNDKNHHQIYVPKGFAHGFLVLSDFAHVAYKVSNVYNSETECGFRWDDPDVGIEWPMDSQVVSERDKQSPLLREIKLEGLAV